MSSVRLSRCCLLKLHLFFTLTERCRRPKFSNVREPDREITVTEIPVFWHPIQYFRPLKCSHKSHDLSRYVQFHWNPFHFLSLPRSAWSSSTFAPCDPVTCDPFFLNPIPNAILSFDPVPRSFPLTRPEGVPSRGGPVPWSMNRAVPSCDPYTRGPVPLSQDLRRVPPFNLAWL